MPLPDFVIIGAQKAGTSAAKAILQQHPDIAFNERFPVRIKGQHSLWARLVGTRFEVGEPHYFTYRWHKGLEWYRGIFPSDSRLVGDKTPGILHHPVAKHRMREVLPRAKIIVLLREPVARAYSQWNHYNQIPERAASWDWQPGDTFNDALEADRDDIFTRSLYADHLAELFELYPRQQVFVGISERMRADPKGTFEPLLEFLGLDWRCSEELLRGRSHIRTYAEPLDPREQERWMNAFRPHNRRLFELLGFEIPEWS